MTQSNAEIMVIRGELAALRGIRSGAKTAMVAQAAISRELKLERELSKIEARQGEASTNQIRDDDEAPAGKGDAL